MSSVALSLHDQNTPHKPVSQQRAKKIPLSTIKNNMRGDTPKRPIASFGSPVASPVRYIGHLNKPDMSRTRNNNIKKLDSILFLYYVTDNQHGGGAVKFGVDRAVL